MKFLIIDTSLKSLYIGVFADGKVYEIFEQDLNLTHSQTLLIKLDSLLNKSSLTLYDMDFFCCVTGPGSFTGIRIGVTTIRAFAQICNKGVVSVNSLQLKAYNIKIKGNIVPLIAAVKDKYYCSVFYKGIQIVPPCVCSVSDLLQISGKIPQQYKEDNISFIYENDIEGLNNVLPVTPLDYIGLCKQMIKDKQFTDYSKMQPFYAAFSQAETNYENKHKKLD